MRPTRRNEILFIHFSAINFSAINVLLDVSGVPGNLRGAQRRKSFVLRIKHGCPRRFGKGLRCAPVLRTASYGRSLAIPTANQRRTPTRRMTAAAPVPFAAAVTLVPQPSGQASLITAANGPERQKRTKGADAVAKDTADEAKNLALVYQSKARETNEKIKSIFDHKKTDAGKITADILSEAKSAAEKNTQSARADIVNQKNKAQSEVLTLAQEISIQLKNKFEGGL